MGKRLFEIFFILFWVSFIVYLISYLFYLDSFCIKYSEDKTLSSTQIIDQMWSCKDSIICEIKDIENDNKNNILNWNCKKKQFKPFEIEFYKTFYEKNFKKYFD